MTDLVVDTPRGRAIHRILDQVTVLTSNTIVWDVITPVGRLTSPINSAIKSVVARS
jgi:hypothetical protein